jgi:hypothetical protein
MRSRIIGVSYNKKEDANTKEIREGIQLRYSFPVKGVIGADVRSDYIGDKDVLEVFRPFLNGRLDDLIGMNAYIDLLPVTFKGETYMRVVNVELMDTKENVSKVK